MQLRANESVFWWKITGDIIQTAQSCKVCQTFFRSWQREILMPHEVPQGLWEKIAANFFEFGSTNYPLIADYYIQFPIVRRMRSTMTNTTIDVMKLVFSKYSVSKKWCQIEDYSFHLRSLKHFQTNVALTASHQAQGTQRAMAWYNKWCRQWSSAWRNAGHDSHLAMLIYRATSLSNSLPAPAEMLKGRRYRALLLTRSLMQNAH